MRSTYIERIQKLSEKLSDPAVIFKVKTVSALEFHIQFWEQKSRRSFQISCSVKLWRFNFLILKHNYDSCLTRTIIIERLYLSPLIMIFDTCHTLFTGSA